MAIALSVAAADLGCLRKRSADGWTRQLLLEVALLEPDFWQAQVRSLEAALRFLTGDIWRLRFVGDGAAPPRRSRRTRNRLKGDHVCLLSGGVDSLIGAIDSVDAGGRPVLVSQVAKGDGPRQRQFADAVGSDLSHLQLTHAIKLPGKKPESERSQRARSMVFLAYATLAASVLARRQGSETVDILVPENGFISLNVPLTPLRLGSLSTRTTHPHFLSQIENILIAAGFQVRLVNPYQIKTKGEMLVECADQQQLRDLVFGSTSCGRFARFNFKHCGRCVPCLVRRAAFLRWGLADQTTYEYEDLSIADKQHRDFDDVRSAIIATMQVSRLGVAEWAGDALSTALLGETAPYLDVAARGIAEIHAYLNEIGVA